MQSLNMQKSYKNTPRWCLDNEFYWFWFVT